MIPSARLDPPEAQAAPADGNSLGRVVVPTMDPLQTASARSLNSRWGARRGLCAPDGTLAAELVSRGLPCHLSSFSSTLAGAQVRKYEKI